MMKWWDESWNPVTGCTKVSEGCKHCYAEAQWPRFRKLYNGREFTDVACHPERLGKPLERKKPTKYFVNSMSDLFHESVPDDFIDKVFAVIALSPQHTFMICTKRAERMREYFSKIDLRTELVGIEAELIGGIERYDENENPRWPLPLSNVYLGVTAENQDTADERIPLLLETPAAKRFVSCEPLLGCIDLDNIRFSKYTEMNVLEGCGINKRSMCQSIPNAFCEKIDLVIAGGESGPKARPTHPYFARILRDQCQFAGTAFLWKQNGEYWTAWTMLNGQPIFKEIPNYQTWVSKGPGWIHPGDACLDAVGNVMRNGSDWKTAYYPVTIMNRVGKKRAGRLLDGVEHNGSI